MNKDRSIGLLSAAAIFIFAVTTLAHNLVFFKQYCYSAYDLGIYMEAVQKFGWSNWNPFLSSRGVGFLNDHWHPALILAKLPALILPTSTALFLTEIFFVVATALVPFYLVRKGLLRLDLAALICMYLVLDQREFEAAMAFPVHPAVWANFLLLSAVALILKKEKNSLIFSILFAAGFFGEQFSLCLMGYSLVLFGFERRRSNFVMLIISVFWVWFSLSGRAYLTGPILHQTNRVAMDLESFILKYSWDRGQLKNFLKFVLECLPISYVAFKGRRYFNLEKSSGLLLLGIFAPLILGRILSGSFGHQYDTLLIATVGAFAMWIFSNSERFSLSPGFLTGALVFFCLMSFSKFEQAYGVISETKLQSCIHSRDKQVIADRVRGLNEVLDETARNNSREIFALGNLVPNLVERFPQAEVICLGMPSRGDEIPDLLITERGVCGDSWPFDQASLETQRISLLAKFPALETLKESACVFSAAKK